MRFATPVIAIAARIQPATLSNQYHDSERL